MIANAEYKCRRCNTVRKTTISLGDFLVDATVALEQHMPNMLDQPVCPRFPLLGHLVCMCNDGGVGCCDLIGMSEAKEPETT